MEYIIEKNQNLVYKYHDLYNSYIKLIKKTKDLSKKKKVYPSLKKLNQNNYNELKISSYYDKYLYIGEHWNHQEKYCDYANNIKYLDKSNKNKTYRICTFNVHNWLKMCKDKENKYNIYNKQQVPKSFDYYKEIIKKINADILCLQEIVPLKDIVVESEIIGYKKSVKNNNFLEINDFMESIGYKYYYIINCQKSHIMDTKDYFFLGNAIYSKIKFEHVQGYILPGDRGFIEIIVELDGKKILIYNTHIEYYNQNIDFLKRKNLKLRGPYNDVTGMQIDLLTIHIIQQLAKLNIENILILGDFNKPYSKLFLNDTNRNKYRYKYLEKNYYLFNIFFKDTYLFTNRNNQNNRYSEVTNFSQNLVTDFIYTTKILKNIKPVFNEIIFTDVSDHYPVILDFKMN